MNQELKRQKLLKILDILWDWNNVFTDLRSLIVKEPTLPTLVDTVYNVIMDNIKRIQDSNKQEQADKLWKVKSQIQKIKEIEKNSEI